MPVELGYPNDAEVYAARDAILAAAADPKVRDALRRYIHDFLASQIPVSTLSFRTSDSATLSIICGLKSSDLTDVPLLPGERTRTPGSRMTHLLTAYNRVPELVENPGVTWLDA